MGILLECLQFSADARARLAKVLAEPIDRASLPPKFCQLDEIDLGPNPLGRVFHRDDQWFDHDAVAPTILLALFRLYSSTVTVGKSFIPASVSLGNASSLTLTLSNANPTAATLTAPLTDTLPNGLVTAGNATNTCGGSVTVSASKIVLTGGAIPASGSCTLSVPVTAAIAGSYVNLLPAGALQTSNGSNTGPSIATLTVVGIPSAVAFRCNFSVAYNGGVAACRVNAEIRDATLFNAAVCPRDNLVAVHCNNGLEFVDWSAKSVVTGPDLKIFGNAGPVSAELQVYGFGIDPDLLNASIQMSSSSAFSVMYGHARCFGQAG